LENGLNTSRTTEVVKEIRNMIVGAVLRPGERLRIEQLCEALSVSPGAVREALSRLSAEGLVISRPQRGFVVSPVSLDDLRALTDVRVAIEAECLRRAIRHGSISWEAQILAQFHKLSNTSIFLDPSNPVPNPAWKDEHRAFHEALTSACDNVYWLRLREQLFLQSERYRALSGPYDESGRDIESEHRQIMQATVSRDADRAVELVTQHLRATAEILEKSQQIQKDQSG
jgi:DNA-binding GntR family transcriptional regulator